MLKAIRRYDLAVRTSSQIQLDCSQDGAVKGMKPFISFTNPHVKRAAFLASLIIVCGCHSPLFRGQSPDVDTLIEVEDKTRLIGDVASPYGLTYQKVESVGLVTRLRETGSDPSPGTLRKLLIAEMQSHDVKSPNQELASSRTSLVLVRGFIPPGARKGSQFDIDVLTPAGSETTSLGNGWLMQSRLSDHAVVSGTPLRGHITAFARGPVLIQTPTEENQSTTTNVRGRVLGGGYVSVDRSLGLAVRDEHASIRTSTLIGNIINNRFHTFNRGVQTGVANPKRDNYVEIVLHPRYKNNVYRYMKVLSSLSLSTTPAQLSNRLQKLQHMLLEPTTAANAALQLEAIGKKAQDVLIVGSQSDDPEVQFYASEALAYLDVAEAAEPLAKLAHTEPAFRWHALTALAAMDHVTAYDALTDLLDTSSIETRYGAFRALRNRNPRDPFVRGEILADEASYPFFYHFVPSEAAPFIHCCRHGQAEIVVFGRDIQMTPPKFLFAGKEILLTGTKNGKIKVSRFSPGRDDIEEYSSTALDDVVRTIIQVGGGYTDVVAAIQGAKESGDLNIRVAFDAGPRIGREFRRDDSDKDNASGTENRDFQVANPVPTLFSSHHSDKQNSRKSPAGPANLPTKKEQPTKSFFARMVSWVVD